MDARISSTRRNINRSFHCLGIAQLLISVSSASLADSVSSFEDIQYWIGAGANQAAVVFDWDDINAAEESLVWGYRWDGAATGEDMLREVLAADERLNAKLSPPSGSGTRLYGWGFDRNEDCQFSLSDGTTFDSDGLSISGPPDNPPPAAVSTDQADNYAEGWFTGFWHYVTSSDNPLDGGNWTSDGSGMSLRSLADGDWDGWTYTQDLVSFSAIPENPHAAVAPLTADFDCDAEVDGIDFLAWQRGFEISGVALRSQGDATSDGNVDGHDLLQWSTQYGSSRTLNSAVIIPAGAAIPEPTSFALTLIGLILSLSHLYSPERRDQ